MPSRGPWAADRSAGRRIRALKTWFGIAKIVGGACVWRGGTTAVWVTALIGGLAEVGYFVFVGLPGYNLLLPGTLMTIVSAAAIVPNVGV